MLSDASEAERAILGGFTYYPNAVVLHHDPALMPRSPHALGRLELLHERHSRRESPGRTHLLDEQTSKHR